MGQRSSDNTRTIRESSQLLARVISELTPNAVFTPATVDQIEEITEMVPLSDELKEWYLTAAPQISVWLLQFGNDLELYAINDFLQRNQLYNHAGSPPQDGWSTTWVVIGDVGGDPIVVDTRMPGSPVLMGSHGFDTWSLTVVSPTLEQYLHALARWIEVCLLQSGAAQYEDHDLACQQVWDEDGDYLPQIEEKLRRLLSPILPADALALWL